MNLVQAELEGYRRKAYMNRYNSLSAEIIDLAMNKATRHLKEIEGNLGKSKALSPDAWSGW